MPNAASRTNLLQCQRYTHKESCANTAEDKPPPPVGYAKTNDAQMIIYQNYLFLLQGLINEKASLAEVFHGIVETRC